MNKNELDQLADNFLKENDEYYKDKNPHKIKNKEYPYLTENQIKYRNNNEIPLSGNYIYESKVGNYIEKV